MFDVKNISDKMQKVQVRDPKGGFLTVHLKPGESGAYDVDARQARFQPGGALTATPVKAAKASKAKAAAEPDPPQTEPPAAPVED